MAFPHRLDAPELPDFSMLKRLARDQLIYLLEQLPGKKDLFIEADLMSPLDRIANVSILKQHEVDKLYKVENKPVLSANEQLCFLVRPRIKNMRYIANLVNADKLAGRIRKYKVILTPQKFYACEMVLEEEGVYGDVSCDEWAFSLLPLDVDLLSMELPEFFRDYFLEGDQRWINTVAQALHLLSTLYGPFPNCYGIGRCAKMSYDLWRKLEEEEDSETKGRRPEIGHIFLLDRDMDFVTALCSQVVYEGLVDDTFRIKCGSVDFGPEVTSSDKSLKVLLNAEDKVFNEIRNEHFSNVFGFLSQKARNLQAQYDRRRGMDIKQMKNFVSQELKGLKQEHRLLSLHIGACESIMKKKTKQDFQELIKTEHALLEGFNIRESTSYIEEHIDRQEEKEITVLQLEKDLRTQVELMRKQKKERKQELKLLQEQDQELCEILCLPLYDVESSSVPTLEELNQFRQRVATLKETKESRHEQFVSIKRQIILCMEELEHTPDTSFEKDVVCEDESAFCLSLENIATLQKLLQQLEIKKSKNEAECEGLRAQIRELWDRLQIPEEEREPVAAIMTGSKAKVRNALQLEVDRLEELKMQNIKQVIETIRVELARFWDQCFYSQEQRQAFAPYYSEDYTENLLHLHDAEIVRLRNHYEVHKELFEGVQKWEESWKLFLEFERKASDPSRFTNRGGNLLKEEKERAKLQKTLPKLEEELKARIEKWEQEQSMAFVVNGQKFMEYVTEQWELHRLEKERAKQERQLKNKKQTETEMLYGSAPRTPCKRPGMTPNKPGKVRKMNTTTMSSATPNSSIRPVFGTMYHSPVSRPPPGSKAVATSMCSGKKTPRAAQLRANKENMELNGSILSGGYSGSTPLQHNCSIKSVASTYSEFSKDPSLSDSSTVGLQRELSKASRADATSRILNSTNIQS